MGTAHCLPGQDVLENESDNLDISLFFYRFVDDYADQSHYVSAQNLLKPKLILLL